MTLKAAGVTLIDCVHDTPKATSEGYPYVAIPQMKNGRVDFADTRKISAEDFTEWTKKARPRLHDVVLSRRTNPGVTATFGNQCDFALGQNLVLLRADGSRVIPEFLRWLLVSPSWWEQIDKYRNVGAVFDRLRCADVPRFELPIPSIPDQRKITEVLSDLDTKIDVNRQINETLEAMARAIFKDWFVDFGPIRAKMEGHAPYLTPEIWSLFPDRLDDQGKPEGWEQRRVEDVLELAYGKALPANERADGRVPVYGSGGVTGVHSKSLVNGPSVVVGRKGTVGSLFWEDRAFFPIDTVFFVVPKAPLTFCYYLLKSLGLDEMNTDAAVPGLNRNNVYRLTVPWSSEAIRNTFDTLATTMRSKIRVNTDEMRTLSDTRNLLLPKLMSGEIKLGENKKSLEFAS